MGSYRFRKDYRIIYCNVAKNLMATPVALLHFLEDSAISHSDASNLGIYELGKQGVSWVLSGWTLRVMRYPGLKEGIRVETWATGFERFRASREFEIFDEAGEVLARASSRWIFINTAAKRPARIPSDFRDKYGIDPSGSFEDNIPAIESIDRPDSSIEYRVMKRDIDSNSHVNNVAYLEWMLEAVEDEIRDSHYPEGIDIVYRSETGPGSVIESAVKTIEDDGKEPETLHKITEKGTGTICALGRLLWR